MMLPNQLPSLPTISPQQSLKVWLNVRLPKKMMVMKQLTSWKTKKEQPAWKQKHRLKVDAAVAVVRVDLAVVVPEPAALVVVQVADNVVVQDLVVQAEAVAPGARVVAVKPCFGPWPLQDKFSGSRLKDLLPCSIITGSKAEFFF
jgi:hypothetical protein